VKQIDNEKMEDQARSVPNNARDRPSYADVDYEKLLFSIFSLLQNLGADERPEVYFTLFFFPSFCYMYWWCLLG
jgi:hypothetical protein